MDKIINEKFILTIEFRYNVNIIDDDGEKIRDYIEKKITIGIYNTKELAYTEGNKILEIFEKYFKLNHKWNNKERFSNRINLISNLAYLKTPFTFYAKIERLDYSNIEDTIIDILKQINE